MPTLTPIYGTATSLTIALSTLTASATLTVGRESTAVDNKDVDQAIDALVGGKIMTGTSTAAGIIEVWAYGSYDDVEFSGAATGVNAALTPADKKTMKLLAQFPTDGTASKSYAWGPCSIANAFGFMPVQWGVWVTHATGGTTNTTPSNSVVYYTPVKLQDA